MNLADRTINAHSGSFRIYPIGDLHANLRSFQEAALRKYVQVIEKDDACLAVVLGDVSDARPREHRFFEPEMLDPRYSLNDLDHMEMDTRHRVYDILKPIASKLLLLRGNHHRPSFTRELCYQLNGQSHGGPVVDLGDRALIRVRVVTPGTSRVFNVFATHVDSGGRKKGSQLNSQLDSLLSFDAEVFLFAHSHKGSYNQQPRSTITTHGGLRLVKSHAQFINAGAWLDPFVLGATGYADSKNLPAGSEEKWFLGGRFATGGMKGRTRGSLLWTPTWFEV